MSLSIDPLMSVIAQDPRLHLKKPKYIISKGAAQNTYKDVIAISQSNSSVQFTAPPPSPSIAVDKKVRVGLGIHLVFKALVTDFPIVPTNIVNVGTDGGPRAYPLSQICSSYAISLNNITVTQNISDYLHALVHYNTPIDCRQFDYSDTPSMLDQFQEYAGDPASSNRSPFTLYGANTAEMARGSWVVNNSSSAPPTPYVATLNQFGPDLRVYKMVTTATEYIQEVDLYFREYLYISPLDFGMRDGQGLIGLQTFDCTLNFGDLTRCWSSIYDVAPNGTAGSPRYSSVVGTLSSSLGQPQMHFNYLTPQISDVIEPTQVYPFYSVDRYVTPGPLALASQAQIPQISSNIQLSSIPKRIYIFARKAKADLRITDPDCYARIDSLSMNFNNKSGLFSGADSSDLYKLSVMNGLQNSWPQWNYFVGSILCIEAKDLSLSPIESAGVLGSYQLNYTVTLTNTSASTKNYELYTVVVSEGTFTISNQQAVSQVGVVAPQSVLNDDTLDTIDYYVLNQGNSFYGGTFTESLKNLAKKAANVGKKVFEIGKAHLPEITAALIPLLPEIGIPAEAAEQIAKLIQQWQQNKGSGLSRADLYDALEGMGVSGGRSSGGRASGGKKMSKKMLEDRLRRLDM